VSTLAQGWLTRPDDNHGVQVECHRCRRAVRVLAGGEDRDYAPRLALRTKTLSRTKRAGFMEERLQRNVRGNSHDCKRGEGRGRKCCRQKMEINFEELGGFEFIQYPKTFSAYYCRGRCPPSYNVASDHALLQGFIHQKRKKSGDGGGGGRRVPRTCCVPSKLSPLMIMHFDAEGSPRITYWENVVAEECKCS